MNRPDDNIVTYYWHAALSRWKLLAAVVLAVTITGWAVSAFILALSPTYEATARLNVVPTGEELGYASRFARGQNADGGLVMAQTYAESLRSREVRETVVDRWIERRASAAGMSADAWLKAEAANAPQFSLGSVISYLNYGASQELPLREQLIEHLGKDTKVEIIEGTFLMQVTVEWDSARDAAWFANALAGEVITEVGDLSEESGESLAGILRQELTAKQAKLAQLKQTSRRRKIELGIVDIDAQKQALLQEKIAEQSRLTSDLAESRRASAQVAALEQQRSGLLGKTQTSIEEQLALTRPTAAAARQSISARQARLSSIQGELGQLSRAELGIKTLDDQIAVLEREVAALLDRLRFSETENLANRATIRLIDPALPPLVRASPKVLLNTILAFVAGCALAGMLLLLLGPKGGRPAAAAPQTPFDRRKGNAPGNGSDGYWRWPDPMAPPTNQPTYHSPQPFSASGHGDVLNHPSFLRGAPDAEGPQFSPMSTGASVVALRTLEQAVPEDQPRVVEQPDVVVAMHERQFAMRLPMPATGRFYDANEVAAHGPSILAMLAGAVAPGQDIHVVSSIVEQQAGLRLTKLLLDTCQKAGMPVRAIRANARRARQYRARAADDASLRIFLHADADEALVEELARNGYRVVVATMAGSHGLNAAIDGNAGRVVFFGNA
ncbi:Wzz/FepE/Etk N-terminal domain-containing protein [Novosphingobium aquimarinum]|uniref:Wzz/FepE/Etk N-terminal domain-containing protein n=1 Tax=Novosphingobium aquimarinum TaxID=2682494 RepID=UPI0018DC9963|nr:Wzz/FepE/Etk N-terminal domain-containing protein [Novosphingobium aquimarinum]